MIELQETGVFLLNGREIIPEKDAAASTLTTTKEEARRGTIAAGILAAHNRGDEENLRLTFDSLAAHDITSVGIILTAEASGMERFPLPFVLTNCHNSLCAVGGTINADDHAFALSAARRYGGIYVPPNLAVIHTYNREMMSGCGRMILASDSHTRYGALGVLAVGEGGGELVKQLLGRTYDMKRPEVVAVRLSGKPQNGVGPHDVALSIIAAVFANGYVKNRVMEFIGDGIAALPVEFRNGIDVMTTETTCWSSVWETDDAVRDYFAAHGRPEAFRRLAPAPVAYYDGLVDIDLSTVEPSIALPFHPSNVYTIREFKENAADILAATEKKALETIGVPGLRLNLQEKLRGGEFYVDQGIIGGCAGGTFDNIIAASEILSGRSIGSGTFSLSIYPESQPTNLELMRHGAITELVSAGAVVKQAFCGPCFGAGDAPLHGGLSIRHATRNFPNREGSKPNEGQIAAVALMDARSIAASAANGGKLTSAAEFEYQESIPKFFFDKGIYEKRVYNGVGAADESVPLAFGPNIKPWPKMPPLAEHLLLRIASCINDPVTTTDELIPSGETSSFRSNPLRLAEFTLSRRDPQYLARAKAVKAIEDARANGISPEEEPLYASVFAKLRELAGLAELDATQVEVGSSIYARKPGDGSAREQAASCQRVLGATANIALEYATKRYRSNLINWGMLPLLTDDPELYQVGDFVFLPGVRAAVAAGEQRLTGFHIKPGTLQVTSVSFNLGELTAEERRIIMAGCLMAHARP